MIAAPVAWITGASSGIGRELARRLHREGYRLALTARRADALEALRAELEGPAGDRVLALPADVTRTEELAAAYGELRARWGVPDLAVANAGVHQGGRGAQLDWPNCRRVLDTNLLGTVHTVALTAPDMAARGSGTVVGIASLAGYRGLPGTGAYCAGKAGLIAFLESIRFELEPRGVRVVVVNPGFVRTPMTDQNDFPMPFLIDAPAAAEAIWRGLRRGRREIAFPVPFAWLVKLMRIIPYPLYHAVVAAVAARRAGTRQPNGV
ncbi:MAG TPA: SDR family NAD(P)-dependent oxidoreductase [Acidobacteriota bacterium]|nr:SDR family NAD(P)-dependent oxidoreductase [Acidobacteriota bacterium]HQM63247.1 SDR family NAD(P)-dependent oxidoreductase [Acidobacteriota bacterium]